MSLPNQMQQFHSLPPSRGALQTGECASRFPTIVDPLLDRAMALAGMGAWSCNLADDRLSWSSGVYDLFGIPYNTIAERQKTVDMYTDESREALERLRTHAIATRGTFTLDAQIVRTTGDTRWMRITAAMNDNVLGQPILHGLKQDITGEKLRFEELRRLAENDALTGLASRAFYESRFLSRRGRATLLAPVGALILFDLDGFKSINDRLGHSAGDACLKVFAERLRVNFPDTLLTARIGGDEFAIIVGDDQTLASIHARIARFHVQLRAPIVWREHVFSVGATSGIAVPSNPLSYDPEELFVRADTALYAAKRASRSASHLEANYEQGTYARRR